MERKDLFIALGQVFIAVLGACVKWTAAMEKKPQRLISLLSGTLSAAFSGIMIFCTYQYFGLNVYMSFALAGVIGHAGARGVDHLGRIIIQRALLHGIDYKPELLDERHGKNK